MGTELVTIPKAGRPTLYSEEMADQIAELIANDISLRKIEALEGMPSKMTIIRWSARYPEFVTKCAHARVIKADLIAEEHREVIDQTKTGLIEPDVARVVLGGLEWHAATSAPKKYGNNKHVEVNNSGTIVHLAGDLSSTLSFLTGDGEDGQQGSGGNIQEHVPDRSVLAAEIRPE